MSDKVLLKNNKAPLALLFLFSTLTITSGIVGCYLYDETQSIDNKVDKLFRSQSQYATVDQISEIIKMEISKSVNQNIEVDSDSIEKKSVEYIPLSADAKLVLQKSKDIYLNKLRNIELQALVENSKLSFKSDDKVVSNILLPPDYNNGVVQPENLSLSEFSISDQMSVQSLITVNGETEAIVKFGNEHVPLKKGMNFNGVKVVDISSQNVTLFENGKQIIRSLEHQQEVEQIEKVES
ncbi:hypothetical protein ABT56_18835 [Photobacterium aquae]|uniref:Uncharacterized protein n=1 Tax=Photobacterium aquae TaxID=1195763 RepID=A0A0J1GUT7_9GAMM|nr:hypothetical protein [Photobacterium aquae]KLV03493.1 hypothetical protein ABT56_18835 [Photobacterium aquae]